MGNQGEADESESPLEFAPARVRPGIGVHSYLAAAIPCPAAHLKTRAEVACFVLLEIANAVRRTCTGRR